MRKMVRNSNGEHMPHFVMSSLACVHVYVAHSLAMEQCISLCFTFVDGANPGDTVTSLWGILE